MNSPAEIRLRKVIQALKDFGKLPELTAQCLVVRNVSGRTLKPGEVVRWKEKWASDPQVDAFERGTGDMAGVVDLDMAPGGIPYGCVFWLDTKGFPK